MFAAKNLLKIWNEKGPKRTRLFIQESFDKGEFTMEDFSIQDLCRELIPNGHEFVRQMDPRAETVLEASPDVVDTSAFSQITGQLMFSTIKQALEDEDLIGDMLVSSMPSNLRDEEKIPGISNTANEFENEVPEGKEFPLVGLSEEFVMAPRSEVHGGIIGITRQMIRADKTGVLIQRAREIGIGLAVNREITILKTVLGLIDNDHNANGERRNTYAAAGANMGFNNLDNAELLDYSDIIEVEEVFRTMSDPHTGRPLRVSPKVLLCAPTPVAWVARRLIKATEVRNDQRPVLAAGVSVYQPTSPNPIPYALEVVSSDLVPRLIQEYTGKGGITAANRTAAVKHWFLGDFKKAFYWKELVPLEVKEEPPNSSIAFERDVMLRFRVMYDGSCFPYEPRYVVRSDGTDT